MSKSTEELKKSETNLFWFGGAGAIYSAIFGYFLVTNQSNIFLIAPLFAVIGMLTGLGFYSYYLQ